MKNTLSLLVFLSLCLITVRAIAQCPEAENYVSQIQQADSWTPTKRASSGKQIQAWTQLGSWYNYRCECENGGNLSDEDLKRLVDHLNLIKGLIAKDYSAYGSVPNTSIPNCKKKGNSNSNGLSSGKTSTQIEMENRFRNYNNAMSLKEQGENIAKAYAQQVKSYGELNRANSPEALLQNFNNNMQAIADLQTQNKADNLNQLTNTLSSTINDLNSGNHEGAMFSALSLLDQGEAKREARRDAENIKWLLNYEKQQQMSQFYIKALELNDQAIKQYNEKAAYAYSKEEETYLLEYVSNLECHKQAMQNNFSYSNASWTQNRCAIPEKKTYTVNNLIAKDIQYINAAKRKYTLYEKTGEPIFQQGAMRFAGLAATEKPKTDYYYLMGHFAGINNPLVAYSSFLTVKSKNTKYFEGDKKAEYSLIKLALEAFFKTAIEENNQDIIKNIVGAGLHQSVVIDGSSPIVYAIKIDQAAVVYAFLNTELEGKPHSIIIKKVQEVISMAAILDAPKTIQKFVDLGFEVDFSLNGTTPIDLANNNLSENAYTFLLTKSTTQEKYLQKFKKSPINIFLVGKNDPISGGKKIDNDITDNDTLHKIIAKLIKESTNNTNYYYILGSSIKAREIVNNNPKLKNIIEESLLIELVLKETSISKASDIISSEILEYSQVPTLGSLLPETEQLKLDDLLLNSIKLGPYDLDFFNSGASLSNELMSIQKGDNIAFIAVKKNDPKLFSALDKVYDLNIALNSDKTPLLISLLTSGALTRQTYIDNRITGQMKTVEKAYFSKDFNFNKIMGQYHPIEILLKNATRHMSTNYQTKNKEFDAIKDDLFTDDFKYIIDTYKVDLNIYLQGINGTILHWYVSTYIENVVQLRTTKLGEFIETLNVDKSIVNNQNLTAFQFYTKNKEIIKKNKPIVFPSSGGTKSTLSFLKSILK